MKKLIFVLIILFTIASCKKTDKIEREDEPTIYNVEQQDTEMNKAIAEAKKTVPEFYNALESGNPDYDAFGIKMRFNTSDSGGEHIWINGLFKKDGEYFGVVDNLPEFTKEVEQGDTIKIDKNQLSDWMYLDKNKLKGGYTIRLLRDRMSEEERTEFDKTSGMIVN